VGLAHSTEPRKVIGKSVPVPWREAVGLGENRGAAEHVGGGALLGAISGALPTEERERP